MTGACRHRSGLASGRDRQGPQLRQLSSRSLGLQHPPPQPGSARRPRASTRRDRARCAYVAIGAPRSASCDRLAPAFAAFGARRCSPAAVGETQGAYEATRGRGGRCFPNDRRAHWTTPSRDADGLAGCAWNPFSLIAQRAVLHGPPRSPSVQRSVTTGIPVERSFIKHTMTRITTNQQSRAVGPRVVTWHRRRLAGSSLSGPQR